MKRFIIQVLLFLSPVIVLAVLMEALLRNIPNDYQYKCDYLNRNSNKIDVLILGSSHAYYGINPQLMTHKSFNAAYVAQSLFYDWQIIKKYDKNWHHLKFIILPVDYFSLYGRLENGIESWRVKDYNIYYGISSSHYTDNSELLSNKLRLNVARIKSVYFNHESDLLCSKFGWGTEYLSQKRKDLPSTGALAAKRHFVINEGYFNENVAVLTSIIKYAAKNHIKVLLYTSPAYKTYVQNLNRRQLNSTIGMLYVLSKKYDNVFYWNLLNNHSFNAVDFYDADHLDNLGAGKLTHKMDSLISMMEKGPNNRFSSLLVSGH
ncbi:hypothetical protein [Mucilaginibacter pocheonensis]|uniref:DUF1574 domain-containing protein n=1 Tax=Mucilaginibacter pocheonensis TaxID=398050 RepID=A0ABU1T550_9SPHI|nr:hypothetical protein [Mucilaginibacter pocheonensis]MDR6940525.1 hypothetical protein [Mucilaginibacter pocheonensis]